MWKLRIFHLYFLSLLCFPTVCSASTIPNLSEAELKALPKDGGKSYNRLIFEKSPYLLQHATNPVNWFPWGDEAFEKARRENKPIFLSVGYSSCHWCHVMEKESFSNSEVAAILNKNYVAVKVDREERPDIDSLYMLATQIIQRGRGGWPNSVWLTPDLKPFFAGTYFPREDQYGRAGFITILNQIYGLFSDGRKKVDESAEMVASAMKELLSSEGIEPQDLTLQSQQEALRQVKYFFTQLANPKTQGPKFPPHQKLVFLLDEAQRRNDSALLNQVSDLLKTMAMGGIYDQIGGGFHRYSTDGKWFLPHFEKMLYDNAQLALVYARAFELTKSPFFEQVCRETIDFVLRDLRSSQGTFFSAFDADSEGKEGVFYLWREADLIAALSEKSGRELARLFQFQPDGNYFPEAGKREKGWNIPYLKIPVLKSEALKKQIQTLRKTRSKRVWPLRDDKVLVSWNGLMIRALVKASSVLSEPAYLKAAQKAAQSILDTMLFPKRLYHNSRGGKNGVPGYLTDYAFFARALVALFEVDGQKKWLVQGESLVRDAERKFKDSQAGGYFLSSLEHDQLLVREKDKSDNVIPSAAGVLTDTNFRLFQITKKKHYLKEAHQSLRYYHSEMMQSPMQTLSFMEALQGVYQMMNPATGTKGSKKGAGSGFEKESFPLQIVGRADPSKSIIELNIKIEDEWHINSSEPYQEYLIATKIEPIPDAPYRLGTINYPPGIDLELDFSDEALSVYEGTVPLKIPYYMDSKLSTIDFFLHTQACSDSECRRPEKHLITIPLTP